MKELRADKLEVMSRKHSNPKTVNTAVNSEYEPPFIPLPEDILDPEKKYTRVVRYDFSNERRKDE